MRIRHPDEGAAPARLPENGRDRRQERPAHFPFQHWSANPLPSDKDAEHKTGSGFPSRYRFCLMPHHSPHLHDVAVPIRKGGLLAC